MRYPFLNKGEADMRQRLNLGLCLIGLFCAGTGVSRAESLPCQPLKGIEAVFARPDVLTIWVGEMHGTNEMPALFADMVCAAGADGHPVVVVIERMADEEVFWRIFLDSEGGDQAKGTLLLGRQWSNQPQDGRGSAAMLDLADHLRRLNQAGRPIDIDFADRLFDPEKPRDAQMAQTVLAVRAKHPDARILVFSGNLHAMKAPPPGFQTAASLLPTQEIISVNILSETGKIWADIDGVVGEHAYSGDDHSREIVSTPNNPAYDFAAYTGLPSTPSPPALSEGLALIRPVFDAFAKVEAEQSQLTPATTDRERLERMYDIDQAGRDAAVKLDYGTLPAFQHQPTLGAVAAELDRYDWQNQTALKAMMPREGWFLKSQYGAKASKAAFLIVQHATNDPDLMRLALSRIELLVGKGEIDDAEYALLYDRVALDFDHKPQRYGTQVMCVAGKWLPKETEAPEHLDERRKSVGLFSEADYLKFFADHPCH
jgi:hypothetical protein